MSKIKRILSMPALTIAAFVLSALLLLSSGIGGARAALTYYSETYATRVSLSSIGVTLNENGEAVSFRNYSGENGWSRQERSLLEGLFQDGEPVKLGARYQEELSVTNSGTISQYVRVSIHKYWTDEEGVKNRAISPDMIRLNLVNQDQGWMIDQDASTPERTVLYYCRALAPGETTPLFADGLSIDPAVATRVTQEIRQEGNYTEVETTYDYDGCRFCVEVKVDAVQEHNAEDAIWSAWGREASRSGDSLELKQ